MKKLLILTAVLFLLSCSKDDNNEDCKCTMKVYVSDGTTTGQYFIIGIPSDCNGRVLEVPPNLDPSHFPTMVCE